MHRIALLALLALVGCSTPAGPPPPTYLEQVRAELRKEWPDNRTINIVAMGHSVPAGYFLTPTVQTFDAYPHLLHVALAEKYPSAVVNVIVSAVGGEASAQGLERFDQVLAHRPDVLLIDYGLNDRALGVDAARANLTTMVRAAKAAGAKVLLLAPTGDRAADLDDPDDPLNRQAEMIRDLAQREGVGLVDPLPAFDGWLVLSADNHPNERGHAVVVRELMRWF